MKYGLVVLSAGFTGLLSFTFLAVAIGTDYWYIIDVNKPNHTGPNDLSSHSGLWRIIEGCTHSSYNNCEVMQQHEAFIRSITEHPVQIGVQSSPLLQQICPACQRLKGTFSTERPSFPHEMDHIATVQYFFSFVYLGCFMLMAFREPAASLLGLISDWLLVKKFSILPNACLHKVVVILLPLSLVLLVFGWILGLVSSLACSPRLLAASASYVFLCSIFTLSGVSIYIKYSNQAMEEFQRIVPPENLVFVHVSFGWSLALAWLSYSLEVATGLLLLLAARITQIKGHYDSGVAIAML